MPGFARPFESDAGGNTVAARGDGTRWDMRAKVILFPSLTALVTLLYFGTLRSSLFEAMPVPVTALDSVIPFVPTFIFPYISFFLLIVLPLVVIDDAGELRDV